MAIGTQGGGAMMTKEEALELGVPEQWIDKAFLERNDKIMLRTQKCDDCGAIIKVHPDARWRLRLEQIRCNPCIRRLLTGKGLSEFEASYVV